jgi:amino acid permease
VRILCYVPLISESDQFHVPYYADIAASFVNTVILSSALSAGNHALYAGTRRFPYYFSSTADQFMRLRTIGLLYSLATTTPPLAPRIFARTTRKGVPIAALLATSSMTGFCFATSYIGSGVLWGWLQNIVGVSNQVCQ